MSGCILRIQEKNGVKYIIHFDVASGPPRLVRLGEYNRNAPFVGIGVEQAIPHRAFKKTEYYNDIGLIRLTRSVQFNEFIRPACLPETYGMGTEKAIATGWEKTDCKSDGSDILMKIVLELYPDEGCRQLLLAEPSSSRLKDGIVARTQFCADTREENDSSCHVSSAAWKSNENRQL